MLIIFHYIGILIFQILQKRKRQKRLENIKDRVEVKLVDFATSTQDDMDNFNENLDLKCGSTTVHNLGNIIDETDLESNIKFDPPVFRQRYAAVYQTLIDERWRTKILKLCDFGCAEFGLFTFIKKLNRLNDILFVDIDEDLLKDNIRRIHPLTIEYLKRREEPLTVIAFAGSVGDPDYRILNTDVITAIELIEHLYPDVLEAFPYNVFNYAQPKLVIITTPNADFNVLFSNPLKFRHDDHKFEWTREQFQDWANNIIIRFPDYLVNFSGLGEGPDGTYHLGHCSQMALFIRKDLLNENYKLQKYSISCICPNNADCEGTDPSSMSCKCVCPCCSPKSSYGICSFNSLLKMVLIDQIETKNKNESLNIFYKAVEKIEYPFERDNRSEEEKLMDEFTYRINSLGQPNSRFFVEERERAEIPLRDLLYGPDDGSITVTELSNLLAKHNYQIEKCVIPETKELETCVIFEPLMDNTTSSSEHSDFDTNSGYYQSVKGSLSDWEDAQQDQKEFKVDSSSIEAQQKKELNKLEDELSDTQKKIRAIKAESSKQIEKYNNDIKKLHSDILHIESKAERYNSTNNKLFNQIWDMNRKNVLDILDKIFQTDKVLNEQVLGVHWNSPDYRDIDKHYMPSYRHAQEALQHKLSSAKLTAEYRRVQKQPEVRGSPSTNIQDLDSNRAYRRLVKHLLMLVSDKSGFLTENRLKSIINNYEDRDRTIVKLCNVFDCLDLQKSEDIDALVSYFLPFCYCSICAEFDSDPSSESDTLHDALSESETTRSPAPRTKKSKISKLPIIPKQLPTRVPTDEQEETDLFEETVSTPSLSSQDNKVHLKRASNIEKTGFIPPPPPLDVNKMKLDFNHINELDRVHNIPIGRHFFGHLLRPPTEKLRRSYLRDRDCLPGPSNIPTKKRKKMRVAGMTSDPEDDISPLDDMKSVTNCIVENTLNKLNVDEVKSNKDDVIEFNLEPVEEPKIETDAMEVDMEHNGNVEDGPMLEGSSSTPISQNIQDETLPEPDIENHKIRLAVDLSPIEQDPNLNNCISSRIVVLSNVPPNTVLPIPVTPIAPNIQIPTAPLLQYEIREQEEKYQDIDRRDIARASREAIVDPNSVQDLLEDFDVNNSVDELTGVDIVDLGNCILIGIHPVLEDTDTGQTSNGFPHWLLQILGTAPPIPERSIDGTLEEPHYYCQGDGLGVHPSVIAVDLDGDDDDDEHSSQSSNEPNTTDFAEIDPGSSQDISSLPEDSMGTNVPGENQDPLDDTGESGPSPILPVPNQDPGSNSSHTGMQTSKSI